MFSSVEGLYTKILTDVNPSGCGTVVTHRSTDVRVLTTGTLHWAGNQRLVTGVGSNPKFVTFRYWRTDVIYYFGIVDVLKKSIKD